MIDPEKVIERIWTEFLVKVVKPDTPAEQLKYIAEVFHWGAMLMAREIVQNQNEFMIQVNEDLKNFVRQLKGEEKHENPN